MALRFTLSPQVARHLSCCPVGVRRRLLDELSRALVASMAPEVGVLRLSSGFKVGYRLDRAGGGLGLLSLSGPGRSHLLPAPA
ncbi:MAG TPA: hypothetical protein VLQ93_15490 [Myxococcaceae bacterium]|nr:hypothetical protein [Myxococcaceae bacterium]